MLELPARRTRTCAASARRHRMDMVIMRPGGVLWPRIRLLPGIGPARRSAQALRRSLFPGFGARRAGLTTLLRGVEGTPTRARIADRTPDLGGLRAGHEFLDGDFAGLPYGATRGLARQPRPAATPAALPGWSSAGSSKVTGVARDVLHDRLTAPQFSVDVVTCCPDNGMFFRRDSTVGATAGTPAPLCGCTTPLR
jgi:hypothetical protein